MQGTGTSIDREFATLYGGEASPAEGCATRAEIMRQLPVLRAAVPRHRFVAAALATP